MEGQSSRIIILTGPSGAGKSSFIKKLLSEVNVLKSTITYTTRKIRKNESEGRPYYFLSEEEFKDLIKKDFFIEWAKVHSHFYGTSRDQMTGIWKEGKSVIKDLDVQGADSIKKVYPQVLRIFISPPSLLELRKRIQGRDGLNEGRDLELRLENAKKEIEEARFFDFVIVNDDFESSYRNFRKIVMDYLKKKL